MTEIETAREASPPTSASTPEAASAVRHGSSLGRLVGVDLARAIAVFGMFAVHVGPRDSEFRLDGWFLPLAEGHASVLFATLAGFSLMLIAGRREPKTGLAGRQATARIVIRAVILLALGTALAMTQYGKDLVILNFYGVYFLLALPLVRLRAKVLAITAAVLTFAGPLLSFGLKKLLTEPITNSINAYDPIHRLSDEGLLHLLLTGLYPAITWMPFIVTGMALGRLDLSAAAVQRRLAALGTALVAVGFGTSWLAYRLFSGFRAVVDARAEEFKAGSGPMSSGSGPMSPGLGSTPPGPESMPPGPLPDYSFGEWAWSMLTADPHSGTIGDILASLGIAITVIVCATALLARSPRLARLARPVIAVGTMSLTVYVAHLVALPYVSTDDYTALIGFVIVAVLFAGVWSRFFRRGPLEHLLNSATGVARFVR
jgi:uncharacterized membrane protein